MQERGYHDSPSKKILSHTSETFRRGTLLGFRKLLESKKCMDKRGRRGREYQNFPSKICFIVPKKFVEEPFRVSENFWYRKILGIKEGGYHDFSSKLFCLTVPKYFVEEPCCVSESFEYRKILCFRGKYHDFL